MLKKSLYTLSKSKYIRDLIKSFFVTVLYHDVTDTPSIFSQKNNLYVTLDTFKRQLDFLAQNFQFIPPLSLENNSTALHNRCLLTFDDGMKSYLDNAVKVTSQYKAHSLIFLNAEPIFTRIPFWSAKVDYLIESNSHFREQLYLYTSSKKWKYPNFLVVTKEFLNKFPNLSDEEFELIQINDYLGEFLKEKDLEILENDNYVYFGNHLYNHHNAALLGESELNYQFKKNQKFLKMFKSFTDFFSYPFGQPNSCYTNNTNVYIRKLTKKPIFTAYPALNSPKSKSSIFHRISLNNYHWNENLIWEYLTKSLIRTIIHSKKYRLI